MATLAEIRAAVDARLVTLWDAIQTRETQFFTNNGRYWQGRRTHSVMPADGAVLKPDIGTASPPDSSAWPAAIRNSDMEMALEIHAYDGPLGKGYQATVYVRVLGNVWTRSAQEGPETWRQQSWTQAALADA